MGINLWKLLFALAVWIVCIGFTLLPLALRNWRADYQRRFLSNANAFAGGVFLAGGLVHMMTDALEEISGISAVHEFPLIQVLMGVGFMLVFFIEKVPHDACQERRASALLLTSVRTCARCLLALLVGCVQSWRVRSREGGERVRGDTIADQQAGLAQTAEPHALGARDAIDKREWQRTWSWAWAWARAWTWAWTWIWIWQRQSRPISRGTE